MNPLLRYLDRNGILLCNTNPELPALADVGCSWSDVTELIGKPLHENWSTFLYGTAEEWEKRAPASTPVKNPRERLWEILSQTMTER